MQCICRVPIRFLGEPIPQTQMIWHYMCRQKFECIVETGKIRFARPDELRETDPNEFRYPKPNEDTLDDIDHYNNEVTRYSRIPPGTRADAPYNWRQSAREYDNQLYSLSWSMRNEESCEMWRRFAPNSQDVVIQCTMGSFLESIKNEKRLLFCKKPRYGDREKTLLPLGSLARAMFKEEEQFKVESELRFILDATLYTLNIPERTIREVAPEFRFLNVDLNALIEKVMISPKADDKDLSELDAYLKENHIDKRPVHSALRV